MTDIHVEVDGDDEGDGTAERPLRTLHAAQEAARARTARDGGAAVVIGDGVYALDRPLVFGPADSGGGDARVVYQARPGARPVLSGGQVVAGWERVDGDIWSAAVGPLSTRQVYLDGRRLRRTSGTVPAGTVRTDRGYRFPGDPPQWRNPFDVEFVYNINWTQMRGCVAAVDGHDVEMDQPWFDNARWHPMALADLPTRVENVFEWLPDQPGAWYLDTVEQRLYLHAPAGIDMEAARVVAGALESIVDVRGTPAGRVHDIVLRGLTFAHATWSMCFEGERGFAALQANLALTGDLPEYSEFTSPRWRGSMMPAAVRVSLADRVSIDDCRFTHLGAAALEVAAGCRDVEVVGSRFDDVSGTAVQIGNGQDHHPEPEREVRAVRVANNVFRDVALEYQGGAAVWAGYVADTTIAHNDLRDLPYSGVSVGWGWGVFDPTVMAGNAVICNRIERPVQVLLDGGGIYVLSAQPGMVIAGNVVMDQPSISGAIYLDDGTRYVTVEDNAVIGCGPRETPVLLIHDERVVADHDWGSFLFKGRDHVIRHNWWDRETDYSWSFLESGTTSDNHQVKSLDDVPRDLVEQAGLEPAYRDLLDEPPNV